NASPDFGIAKVEHLTWKAILDFYTCTECGRCSDNCPAHKTGKVLSPKHLTLALRDHMYGHEKELVEHEMRWAEGKSAVPEGVTDPERLADEREGAQIPLKYD